MAMAEPITPSLSVARQPGADDDKESIGIAVSDLLAAELEPPAWLVPGYIQEQSINILGGPPNSGKTLLAFDWCAKVVAAGKSVFIAENEGGVFSLQTRLRRACSAAGIPDPPGRFTYRRNLGLQLDNFVQVRAFAKQLEWYDLILLDSLGSLWPGLNENDPQHMSIVAEALKILCENSRAAVLGNHHTTKATWKPGEKPGLGDLRGHGAMAGRIDGAFICRPLERAAGVVRFELHTVKQRDEEWHPPQAVEVLMTGPDATLTMEPLGHEAKILSPLRMRQIEIENAVSEILPSTESEALSQNAICERVKKSKTDVMAAVKRLFLQRLITQTWNGRYFRVKAQQPSDPGGLRRSYSGRDRAAEPPGTT